MTQRLRDGAGRGGHRDSPSAPWDGARRTERGTVAVPIGAGPIGQVAPPASRGRSLADEVEERWWKVEELKGSYIEVEDPYLIRYPRVLECSTVGSRLQYGFNWLFMVSFLSSGGTTTPTNGSQLPSTTLEDYLQRYGVDTMACEAMRRCSPEAMRR